MQMLKYINASNNFIKIDNVKIQKDINHLVVIKMINLNVQNVIVICNY